MNLAPHEHPSIPHRGATNVVRLHPAVSDGQRRAQALHPSRADRSSRALHPSRADRRPLAGAASATVSTLARRHDEDGSLVTEYGLLAVVAATVAGVVIQWASGGALVTLFNALLRHARELVGA